MKIIFLFAAMTVALTGCGPGFLAAATAISGVDAVENLFHDAPDLFQCDKMFEFLGGQTCPKADTVKQTDEAK